MHQKPYLRFVVLLVLILPIACDSGTGPGGGESGSPPENLIGPEGGTITSPDSTLTLEVPAGALDDSVEITASAIADPAGAAPADFVVMDGTGYDLQPDGLTFNQPATLTIRVAGLPLPEGVSLSELRLVQLDGDGLTLPSAPDPNAEVVTGTVEHFSSYGVGLATQFDRVACPDLSLGAADGMPLDTVALGQLPASFDTLVFVMATVDDTLSSYGGVEVDSATGNAAMTVPIHPSADPAGGAVELHVSDGTRACAGQAFTIDALPPAPGELEGVVDLLQDLVDAQAAALDVTRSDIVNTPVDSLPDLLKPLALTQSVVDDPDNDHSLRSIVDGTSSESGDAHVDLLDALLARTGLRSALSAVVTAAEAETRTPAPVPDPAGNGAIHGAGTGASITTGLCTPDLVQDAGFLNYCMEKAQDAAFHGPTDDLMDDASKGMMYASLVPGLGTATAVGGAVIWVVQTEKKRNAALLPSLLTKMELTASPTEFLEDEEGPGTWVASVYATNQGYDMGEEFLSGALNAAGVAGIGDAAQLAGPEVHNLAGWVLTGPVANKLLEGGTIEQFIIDASNYGPIDVSDEAWSASRIVGDAFSIPSHGAYDPEKVGTATLSVRTADGKFGGSQVAEHEELRVKQLYVTASPDEVYLSADEPQTFSFQVHDARHPDMLEVKDAGSLQGTVGATSYIGSGLHTVEYTAPSNPDPSQADLLTVEQTATTGARENSAERRIAIATIHFGKVRISPRNPCVDRGKTQTFTADIQGLGNTTIAWEIVAGGGSLSATEGATVDYTAPDAGSGTITLKAYDKDHPDNKDQVSFQYGKCSGLAVYRAVTSGVSFPFTAGVCGNVDRDETYEEDNMPQAGIDPLTPPDPSVVLINRTENPVHSLDKAGSYGDKISDGTCVNASFRSRSGYDATYTGSEAGDSLSVDIQTYGESGCADMGELGRQCSGAIAAVATTVRWDLDIDQATSYDLNVQLTCDAFAIPMTPEPKVQVITTRKAPDGTLVPPNTSTQPIAMTCSGGNTVTINQTMDFAAPAVADQTDKVMIIISFTNSSPGAIPTISEALHEGYVQGFITLKPH